MVHFDIINAAGNAYKTSWNARRYLAKLCLVPIALKLFCFSLTGVYAKSAGEESSYLTFMLIMIPALFAEGWMLSHYTRFLALGQTWPFRPTGDVHDDMAVLTVRARGILSGMIVYVLINMALGLLLTFIQIYFLPYMPVGPDAPQPDVPTSVALLAFALLVFTLWGFRLLWLYIPLALNMYGRDYIRALKGFGTSLPIIALWLLCFIPFYLSLGLFNALFGEAIIAAFGPEAGVFFHAVLNVVADTAKSIVVTAGIVFGLKEIFVKQRMIPS